MPRAKKRKKLAKVSALHADPPSVPVVAESYSLKVEVVINVKETEDKENQTTAISEHENRTEPDAGHAISTSSSALLRLQLPRPPSFPHVIQRLQMGHASAADLRTSLINQLGNYKPTGVLSGHAFRVYAACFDPTEKYLAAGGEDGHVCLFPCFDKTSHPPLSVAEINRRGGRSMKKVMSLQLHSKWISGLAFADEDRLLSSSDAGDVCISALTRAASKDDFQCSPLHQISLSNLGLYSMHLFRPSKKILTAGKDSAIRITQLTPAGLRETDCFENVHDGVAKYARWRDASVFASVGNDRCLVVSDRRDGKNKIIIPTPHKGVVNTVGWRPFMEHQVFSSAFDANIYLYDTRFPAHPVVTFGNHVPANIDRQSSIYRPTFYLGGRFLVTSAETTASMFFYNVDTGALAHRCSTGATYTTLLTAGIDSSVIAGCAQTRIHLWEPTLPFSSPTTVLPPAAQPRSKKPKASPYFTR